MARIAGVNIPDNKHACDLTDVHLWSWPHYAKRCAELLVRAPVRWETCLKTEMAVRKVSEMMVEGDLRRECQ